jgi:hypothetical protein
VLKTVSNVLHSIQTLRSRRHNIAARDQHQKFPRTRPFLLQFRYLSVNRRSRAKLITPDHDPVAYREGRCGQTSNRGLHMHDDVSHLTQDQRRAELARILALGILRLHRLAPPSLPPDSAQNGLDVPLEQSVHVAAPINCRREPEKGTTT